MPDRRRGGRLRVRSLGQPSRLELADRPRGVRSRGPALRRASTPAPDLTPPPANALAPPRVSRQDPPRHAPPTQLRLNMQKVMQNNCAVFRTAEVLEEGHKLIHEVYAGVPDIRVTDRSLIWNSDLVEILEFDNLIVQAVVTMDSARNRTESRGAMHARISRNATTRTG